MAVTITPTPASGSIVHGVDAVNIAIAGASANDATAYSTGVYPTEPAITYIIRCRKAGVDDLISPVFTPAAASGTYKWLNLIFPSAGTWTVTLRNAASDAQIQTASVVVS